MDWDALCFNIAALVAGVFVLDYGADKFIDHTVIVGRRLRVSPTLIALLTAGAEYEELAVVIAAVLQHRSPLALGNIMGSTISNILGAFSLGLLFHPDGLEFDGSAKMYAVLQLAITTLIVALAFLKWLNRVTGGILIALFAIYMMSIGYAVYKAVTQPPQLSDSESESGSDDEMANGSDERPQSPSHRPSVTENSPLLDGQSPHEPRSTIDSNVRKQRPLNQHVCQLIVGLLALSLAGYILAHSAGAVADVLGLSGSVFGLTVVAFATTLPEKLVSVLSGSRGQGGIMVATTAGSNIFLLTLCVGVVATAEAHGDQPQTFVPFDLITVWVSSLAFLAVVLIGPRRVAGLLLLVAYIVFLVLEFTIYKR